MLNRNRLLALSSIAVVGLVGACTTAPNAVISRASQVDIVLANAAEQECRFNAISDNLRDEIRSRPGGGDLLGQLSSICPELAIAFAQNPIQPSDERGFDLANAAPQGEAPEAGPGPAGPSGETENEGPSDGPSDGGPGGNPRDGGPDGAPGEGEGEGEGFNDPNESVDDGREGENNFTKGDSEDGVGDRAPRGPDNGGGQIE